MEGELPSPGGGGEGQPAGQAGQRAGVTGGLGPRRWAPFSEANLQSASQTNYSETPVPWFVSKPAQTNTFVKYNKSVMAGGGETYKIQVQFFNYYIHIFIF